MADINTGDKGGGGKNKPKRKQLRVDFTPMVDMNMLLITFFMFCTTLSKPQIMNLVVPAKDNKETLKADKPKVADSSTTTVILAGDDVVYYYFGKPPTDESEYDPATFLKKTNYSPDGLRAILVQKNRDVVIEIAELRAQKQKGEITDEVFQEKQKEIRDRKDGQVVIIKPTDDSNYDNLVSVLDEMHITNIGVYAIVEMTDADKEIVKDYLDATGQGGESVSDNI